MMRVKRMVMVKIDFQRGSFVIPFGNLSHSQETCVIGHKEEGVGANGMTTITLT